MKLKRDLVFTISVVGLLLGGCASPNLTGTPSASSDAGSRKGIEEFEKANVLLDTKRYLEAAAAFDKLRVQNPATTLDYFVLLNSGIAYQSAGDCKTAAERYRQTVRVTNQKNPQTQAMARLRLSDVLACEGNDRLAIVNLVELYKGKRYLPAEIAQAEVPAKLAAAYARAGNKKMAEKYFKEADAGFRKVSSANALAGQRPILSKTLFLMGNMSHLDPAKISSEDYFASIDTLQGFLLRSVEMDIANWSDLSAEQLLSAYQKVWYFVDRDVPVPGASALTVREIREEKVKSAQSALIALKELRNMRVPNQRPSQRMSELFGALDKTERQIEGYLVSNRVGTDLTDEAKRASGVRQEGKLVSPSPMKAPVQGPKR